MERYGSQAAQHRQQNERRGVYCYDERWRFHDELSIFGCGKVMDGFEGTAVDIR